MDVEREKQTMEAMIPIFKLMGSGEPEIIEGPGVLAMRLELDDKILTMTLTDKD